MGTMGDAITGQLRPLRVFIVEDHVDTLTAFSIYLEYLGHTVICARTLAEARDLWPQAPCDLLIADLRLPDGEGWALLEGLLSPPPSYPVVISALGRPEDRARSEAAGFRHHLLKPFKLADFDAVLEEAVRALVADGQPTTQPAAT